MFLEAMTLDSLVTSSVAGRVAIVTGAGQGIEAFARVGAIPVIADKNAVHGNSVADEVQAAGGFDACG
jgi:NAD(P)-dependent dehydrogenase (short-subunit alcohol dehydrogenase family)